MGIDRSHARSLRRSSILFATAILAWITVTILVNLTHQSQSGNDSWTSHDASNQSTSPQTSPSSLLSHVESFRSTIHPVRDECNYIGYIREIMSFKYFEMEASLVDGSKPTSTGPGVYVTIRWSCRPPRYEMQPRAMFRVRTDGESLTAVLPQSTILRYPDDAMTVFVPVVDPGEHKLIVSLITFNMTDAELYIDWPSHPDIDRNSLTSRYVDKEIKGSPFVFNMTIDESHRRRSYDEVIQHSAPPPGQPLCFADQALNITLPGRWIRGPRHEHIVRNWQGSRNIYDDFNPVWAPFDCHLDYSIPLIQSLRSLRWFQIFGDSNMRGLFERICQLTNGTLDKGSESVRFMDPPHLCILDEGKTIVTFMNWFYGKRPVWHYQWSFREQCGMYTENLTAMQEAGTVYGWPGCQQVHTSIQDMSGPSLTYFSWGSHAAEAGLTEDTWSFINGTQMLGNEYFKRFPTLLAFTEDVYATIIPWSKVHYPYRNNERIQSFNQLLVDSVRYHWNSWPIDMMDQSGRLVKGFNPIFDVFSPTHAASEVLHGDAVHFYLEVEVQIAKWLAHWIRYAPQLRADLRRIKHDSVR